MKPIHNIVLVLFLIMTFQGCRENGENGVHFILKTKDIQGNDRSVFKHGENIVFEFNVINSTGDDFGWPRDECRLLNHDEFLLVYRVQGNLKTPIGKPHITPVVCQLINLPDQILPPGEHNIILIKWVNLPDGSFYAQNELLEPGEYYTGFLFAPSSEQDPISAETRFSVRN